MSFEWYALHRAYKFLQAAIGICEAEGGRLRENGGGTSWNCERPVDPDEVVSPLQNFQFLCSYL